MLFFLLPLLGSTLTISPIASPLVEQSRGGTVTFLDNQYSVANAWVYQNITYSRSFPSTLNMIKGAVSVNDLNYRITAIMFPISLTVQINAIGASNMILSIYPADTNIYRLKINYFLVNGDYTNSSFNVVSGNFGGYYFNTSSITSFTIASSSAITIDKTGGWNAAAFCYKVTTRYRTYPPLNPFSFDIIVNTNATNVVSFTAVSYYAIDT